MKNKSIGIGMVKMYFPNSVCVSFFENFSTIWSSVTSIYYQCFYWNTFKSRITWLFWSKDSFVDLYSFSVYLSGKCLIRYDGAVSCMISVFVYSLNDQFFASPLLKTLLISAVQTKFLHLIFGFCPTFWPWRLDYKSYSFLLLEVLSGIFLVELWIVFLSFLIQNGNSDIHSALHFSHIGSFNKPRFIYYWGIFLCESGIVL